MKCAIFVASTGNYIGYLNALVNSIVKRRLYERCQLTLFLMHHDDFPIQYCLDAKELLPFEFVSIEILRDDISHPEKTKRIEFVKRARFTYILNHAKNYDAVCLLDADMFIVSPEFMSLFDMVKNTKYCIGCNEGFKWKIGEDYQWRGKPILDNPTKLYQMHCSVPIIFNMHYWEDVFECYNSMCFEARQSLGNGKTKGVGDIYCWNISVYKNNRQGDIIVFPMETMTQVHQTNISPNRFMQCENDYWFTSAGDRVYSIHGRIATAGFVDGHLTRYARETLDNNNREKVAKIGSRMRNGLKAIQREWYDLNFRQLIMLTDYLEFKPEWEKMA